MHLLYVRLPLRKPRSENFVIDKQVYKNVKYAVDKQLGLNVKYKGDKIAPWYIPLLTLTTVEEISLLLKANTDWPVSSTYNHGYNHRDGVLCCRLFKAINSILTIKVVASTRAAPAQKTSCFWKKIGATKYNFLCYLLASCSKAVINDVIITFTFFIFLASFWLISNHCSITNLNNEPEVRLFLTTL